MHCVPCALQTPGAGLPGEAAPPAIRGGGGTRAVLGAGPAAEGRAGGGPAAPAGGGNRPPREADPGPEGGGRGLGGASAGPPPEKREANCPGVPPPHPHLPGPGLSPPRGPGALTLRNVFCSHRESPFLSLSGSGLASPGETQASPAAVCSSGWGPRGSRSRLWVGGCRLPGTRALDQGQKRHPPPALVCDPLGALFLAVESVPACSPPAFASSEVAPAPPPSSSLTVGSSTPALPPSPRGEARPAF